MASKQRIDRPSYVMRSLRIDEELKELIDRMRRIKDNKSGMLSEGDLVDRKIAYIETLLAEQIT
jgi:predicted metal-binding protein